MVDNTCQPSDSVTLYFSGGPFDTRSPRLQLLHIIEMHTADPDVEQTPLHRWQTFYRAWSTSSLGPADSVRLSPDQTRLDAFWRSENWWADLTIAINFIGNDRSNPSYTFIQVRLLCQSLACRRIN
jgi:hypothetical protein